MSNTAILALTAGAAFLAAVAWTPVVRLAARRYGLVVDPRADRWHTRPTALYGGVAVFLGCVTALVAAPGVAAIIASNRAALGIAAAAAVLFGAGVVDDARGMGPVGKLILQLAAASLVLGAGVIYPVTSWTPVNVVVTLFWFVGVTNGINLLDNMDGIAAGVSAVAAFGFAVLFTLAGDPALALLAVAVGASAAGFLVYNFRPASIFMGDGGSLFLGASLAGLGAAYPLTEGTVGSVSVLVPALLLVVPIVDTTLVTITRTLHNRRVSVGGRDHTTHRLVAMGFSEAGTAVLLYGAGVAAVAAAWAVTALPMAAGVMLALLFLTLTLLFTAYLGTLYRYDDGREPDSVRRGPLLQTILLQRRGLVLALDIVLFGIAYYGAFLVYHGGGLSVRTGFIANATLGAMVVLKLATFHFFHVYRGVWDRTSLPDVHRVVLASLVASALAAAALLLPAARGLGIPLPILAIDLVATTALVLAARTSFLSLDRLRQRLLGPGEAALIFGAGAHAEVAFRAMMADPAVGLRPAGFIDDDLAGSVLHGLPILATGEALRREIQRTGAGVLVCPAAARPGDRTLEAVRNHDLRLVWFRSEFARAEPGNEQEAPAASTPPKRASAVLG